MGILDQLKQAAAIKQEQEPPQVREKNLRENFYKNQLLPALQNTFHFMKELVENLNFLDHQVTVEEYSDRYPQFGTLSQKDYKIYTDDYGGFSDFNQLKQVNVRFSLVNDGSFSYNLLGQNLIEQEIAFLTSRKIPFEWKYQSRSAQIRNACFTVTRKIHVFFKFEADYDNSTIRLLILNHENFTLFNKIFPPEEIDHAMLDKIARYMLRKDTDFYQLEISVAEREAIRQLAEQTKRERDLQLTLAEFEMARQQEKQKKFIPSLMKKPNR